MNMNIPEELAASSFRVKTEGTDSSETIYRTISHHIPEECALDIHECDLKSNKGVRTDKQTTPHSSKCCNEEISQSCLNHQIWLHESS
jgi:hypothetical protein